MITIHFNLITRVIVWSHSFYPDFMVRILLNQFNQRLKCVIGTEETLMALYCMANTILCLTFPSLPAGCVQNYSRSSFWDHCFVKYASHWRDDQWSYQNSLLPRISDNVYIPSGCYCWHFWLCGRFHHRWYCNLCHINIQFCFLSSYGIHALKADVLHSFAGTRVRVYTQVGKSAQGKFALEVALKTLVLFKE